MRQLTLHPPLAGLVKSRGFQKQPPYSCRECVNFIPQYALDGSELLAIRPPMDGFVTAAGTVNLLCAVNGTTSDTPQQTFVAAVAGALYRWTGSALTAVGGSGTIPSGRVAFAAAFEQKVYIPAATPLVYDYPSDTLSTWTASVGSIPTDPRIIVPWAGCLAFAAEPGQPHVVSLCKTGDPTDFNYNDESSAGAFQSIGTDAGTISGPVTALIPASGDTLIVSTPNGMWAWRGHPRRGGVADVLSTTIGVRGQGAWCAGPNGEIYALTNKGLVVIQNASTVATISEDRIPAELIGLDYDYLDPRVAMGYDARFNAVYVTVRDDDNPQAWWYDVENGGLFKMTLRSYPYTMIDFDPAGSGRASSILFGGQYYDGVGHFNLDGDEYITEARVVMGPIRLSPNPMERGLISDMQLVLGGGTTLGDAELRIYTGPTGDSAYAASLNSSNAPYRITIEDVFKMHGRLRPRLADHAAVVVLDYFGGELNPQLVFEEANLTIKPAGRVRSFVQHSDTTGPFAGSYTPPPRTIPVASLRSWYEFEESASPFADSHGVGATLATLSGTAQKNASGVSGTAVEISSSTGSIRGDLAGVSFPSGMTLSGWVNLSSGFPPLPAITATLVTAAESVTLSRASTTTHFRAIVGGTTVLIDQNPFFLSGTTNLWDGWLFLAASVDPSDNSVATMSDVFYKKTTGVTAVQDITGASAQTFRLLLSRSESTGSATPGWDGITVWNRPLTKQELILLYLLGPSGYPY